MKKLPTYYYGGVSKEFELAYVQSAWTLEREEFEQALQSFKPPEPPKQKRSSIISNMPGMSRRLTGNSCTSSKHGDLPVIQSNDSITENGKSWMCCNKLTCGILGGGSKF